MSKKAEGFSLRFVLINTGNISRKVLSKVLRSFDKNFERLQTEKGSITLGWKFELLNKSGGDLSGKMLLTDEQVVDVYAGSNLSPDKKNASVCGQIIRDSGVANYILMDENVHSAQDVIDKISGTCCRYFRDAVV